MSLSSTALVISLLKEKKEITQSHGQLSLGILLFQDLMIIPILLLIPFIGENSLAITFTFNQSLLFVTSLALLTVAAVFLVRPFLMYLAKTQSQEIFISSCLLVVLGTSFLMEKIGLTMSLGALISGMFLAKSSLRLDIEKSIIPFKGLLMGLFFMGIGMKLDFSMIINNPLYLFLLAFGLLLLKGVVLGVLGKLCTLNGDKVVKLSILMGGGGEFAFVIFTAALNGKILSIELYTVLLTVVTISMMFSTIFLNLSEKLFTKTVVKINHLNVLDGDDSESAPVEISQKKAA